jgi:hypothetical protein
MVASGSSITRRAEDLVQLSAIRRHHVALEHGFTARATALDRLSFRLSVLRLVAFLATVGAIPPAYQDGGAASLAMLFLAAGGFVAALVWHARVLREKEHAELCSAIHRRHAMRTTREWNALPVPRERCADDHAYAWDLDLVGEGSLMQRIDVSHTVWGERALLDWLCRPASRATIVERQHAVRELCDMPDFRRELEAAALGADVDHMAGKSTFLRAVGLNAALAFAGGAVCARQFVLPIVRVRSSMRVRDSLQTGASYVEQHA